MTTGKRLWIASLGAPQKALRHVRYTRSGSYSLDGVLRYLRPKQREVDNVQPTEDAVDDCPEYRMVVAVRYRDGESAAKAHAIFRTLDSNSVIAISVHVAGLSARRKPVDSGHVRFAPIMTTFMLAQQTTRRATSGRSPIRLVQPETIAERYVPIN
jgi:hypothetical protein